MSIVGRTGAGIIALMMIITVTDVVGRRVFNRPLSGTFEISEFMMVIVAFFTIAHCEFLRGHITVDIVVSRFRQRTRDVIDSTTYLFFLVAFGFVTWQLARQAMNAWENNLTSALLQIPASPIIYVTALGSAILCLLVLIHLLLFIAGALKK